MGSSPRMRGAREALKRRARRSGIIPAYAGSTVPGRRARPRRRIIPAYAGSTWRGRLARRRTRDHPRVCGEHDQWGSLTEHRMGSSPRMRGALLARESPRVQAGIIPAYAGSTAARWRPPTTAWDHPRVCGEHCALLSQSLPVPGSSPRMRGALEPCRVAALRPGIIPAYAGSTRRRASGSAPRRDHPRVCGEHSRWAATRCARWGSSPRMRGAQVRPAPRGGAGGIIPAYAGSTSSRRCRRASRDHPRVCGEHPAAAYTLADLEGSSPRMRGAPAQRHEHRQQRGIIPAYAGSTHPQSW